MIKFLDLYSQYKEISGEIDQAIASVIADSAFIRGEYVETFEKQFAAFQQANYCVGVGNGTDALEIAIEALDLPTNSEILVPANSFIASSEAVTRSGHKVVFCDVNPVDYTIDLDDAERKMTKHTAAIMAVHLYGHPCDMKPLLKFSQDNNLKVIEDCAQAHAAEYRGYRVGALGDVGTFSFFPGKNLGAYGDGGAITTNNEALAVKCRSIANHGRIAKYDHGFEGRNSRLDGLQAAILSVKLKYLDGWTDHRNDLAAAYREFFTGTDQLQVPQERDWARHAYHLFVVRVPDRDNLRQRLLDRGIQCGVHYPVALPKLAAYRYLDQCDEGMMACKMADELLSLPIGGHLDVDQVKTVAETLMDEI